MEAINIILILWFRESKLYIQRSTRLIQQDNDSLKCYTKNKPSRQINFRMLKSPPPTPPPKKMLYHYLYFMLTGITHKLRLQTSEIKTHFTIDFYNSQLDVSYAST